jgi:hypothetical protein
LGRPGRVVACSNRHGRGIRRNAVILGVILHKDKSAHQRRYLRAGALADLRYPRMTDPPGLFAVLFPAVRDRDGGETVGAAGQNVF